LFSPIVKQKYIFLTEICDFGLENDLFTCDWQNRNGTRHNWELGTGTVSNWLGGPRIDASEADDSDKGIFIKYMNFHEKKLHSIQA